MVYIIFRGSRGASTFFPGGSNFSRGRSNFLFPIESHITCVFPGGPGPLPPPPSLWISECNIWINWMLWQKLDMRKSYQFWPPPPLGIPKCIHGVWENNHNGLTRIQIVFPRSDNFRSNPLYFSFCIKTLPDMSSADNLCKQFGPRSGPTFCSGLFGVQTVWHFIGYDKLNQCILTLR